MTKWVMPKSQMYSQVMSPLFCASSVIAAIGKVTAKNEPRMIATGNGCSKYAGDATRNGGGVCVSGGLAVAVMDNSLGERGVSPLILFSQDGESGGVRPRSPKR